MDKYGWIDAVGVSTSLFEYLLASLVDIFVGPIRFLQGLFAGPNNVAIGSDLFS